MADLKERRRRWRGPALGGPLQRGARFCFAAHDVEASTARLTEWCRPELVGGRVKKWHLSNQERALHSIGARKVRRAGRGWVRRLDDSDGSTTEPGTRYGDGLALVVFLASIRCSVWSARVFVFRSSSEGEEREASRKEDRPNAKRRRQKPPSRLRQPTGDT